MTENKRFTVQRIYKGMNGGAKYYDWCVMKNDEIILRLTTRMDCKDVVEVLNELSEENEELKYSLSAHMVDLNNYKGKCSALEIENEQLKQLINRLTLDNTKQKKVLNATKKENEHIKNTIKEAYHNERTMIGQSVLKQLLDSLE